MRRPASTRTLAFLLVTAMVLPALLSGCGGSTARLALIGTWLMTHRKHGSESWRPVAADETVYLTFWANDTFRRERFISQDLISWREGTWVRDGHYLTLRITRSSDPDELYTYRHGDYSISSEDRLTIQWREFDPPDEWERYQAY